jgi:hypothetical protein
MSLYPSTMSMGDIQQMLMGVPRTPSEPSSNEDSFQFDQPRYDPSVKIGPAGQVITPRGGFNPFRGGYQRPSFGRPPMMGGFGGFGGYGSPFGGLGMFGMSPYGGMPNYGMFGGMMSPYMGGMGGFGQRLPSGTRFPQIPKPVDRSTFVTDPTTYYKGDASIPNFQPNIGNQQPQSPSTNFGTNPGTGLSTPSTQQPFQSPNPFMNPFMSGLGSMMGSMFGGGYGSNVSNTQANVAQ